MGCYGAPVFNNTVDTSTRKLGDLVELDPVAPSLGLSVAWRQEIALDWVENRIVVRLKGGKALLYIVRAGPDKVAFTPDGKVLFYDVMADIYGGRMAHPEEAENLQTLVPDHFIYTRDGRPGGYIWNPARNGLSSFWTEQDASGQTIVRFNSGSPPERQTGV